MSDRIEAAQLNIPSPDHVVEIQNLNVRFGSKHVVKNVSFHVNKGNILGFMGISGAGKTTVVRVLIGQISSKNWDGNVTVAGFNPAKGKDQTKILGKIGYVPQLEEKNLYYDLTARKNIDIFAAMYGIPPAKARELGEKLFQILDIPKDTWDKHVKTMSGGEKKRLSMAIGLLHEPEILFLDEPTTGVDAAKRYEILNYLKKLNEKTHTTMVIITHDLEAALICDTTVLLKEGEVLAFDAPAKLIASLPSNGEVVRLRVSELNYKKMEILRAFPPVKYLLRVGNEDVEVFMDDLGSNITPLMQYLHQNNISVDGFTRDVASFKRFFQLRIQETATAKELIG